MAFIIASVTVIRDSQPDELLRKCVQMHFQHKDDQWAPFFKAAINLR